jgi:hypothetical protein
MDRWVLGSKVKDAPGRLPPGGVDSRVRGGNGFQEVLTIVRRQPVQTFLRFATPSMTTTLDWMFGLNMRFVRRFEKLTLWPNLVVLPQTSHLPATSRFLPLWCPSTGPGLCFVDSASRNPNAGAQNFGLGQHSRDPQAYHVRGKVDNGAVY